METPRHGELRSQLEVRLQQFPQVNDFFRESLTKRTQHPDWLQNEIIRAILINNDDFLKSIEAALSYLKEPDKKLLKRMKGNEKDYDTQILDVWAEVVGYGYLATHGHSEIKIIPRKLGISTADLSSEKDGKKFLTEVAHVHAPDGFSSMVWRALDIMHLEEPERFSKYFHIDQEGFGLKLTDEDKWQLTVLLEVMRQTVNYSDFFEREWGNATERRKVKIASEPAGGKYYISEMGSMYWESPEYIATRILPPMTKLIYVLRDKITQLTAADQPHEYEHIIFIHWALPESVRGLNTHVTMTRSTISELAKKIDSRLEVVFS